jgi:hypothetical protein
VLLDNTEEEIKQHFQFTDKVGGYKFESKKSPPLTIIDQHEVEMIQIKQQEIKTIYLNNEMDNKEADKIYEMYNNVATFGEHAGVGKTTKVKRYDPEVLLVCPDNRGCLENKHDNFKSITTHKFFNMLPNCVVKTHAMDGRTKELIENAKTVCFDEIYQNSIQMQQEIYKYTHASAHKEKKFLPTGDFNQNEFVGIETELNNIKDVDEYMHKAISKMFPTQIILKNIKRAISEEDKKKLEQFRDDMFNSKMTIMEAVKKLGLKEIHSMDELKTLTNICYFNDRRAKLVNNYIHNNVVEQPKNKIMVGDMAYWAGLKVIYKGGYNSKFFPNYVYEITKINTKSVTLLEPWEGEIFTIKTEDLKYFSFEYALTGHQIQGGTIKEGVKTTVFDVNTPYVSRKWVYTALTKNRRLSDIQLFIHSENEVKALTQARLRQYFKWKVEGYKRQDKVACREFKEEDYVDDKWIHEEYKKCGNCQTCNCAYELFMDDNNTVHSNITVQRKDNKLGHVKDNCCLMCKHCNVTIH